MKFYGHFIKTIMNVFLKDPREKIRDSNRIISALEKEEGFTIFA